MLHNELAEVLPLDGPWQFALGPEAAWSEINVPGCWEAQGYAMVVDGPARYRRSVMIPAAWAGSSIRLEFGAVSYACQVSCNGVVAGSHLGLWTPFDVDLTSTALPGQENVLELVIYKPGEKYPMRSSLAGFLPDVATTFGGVWQEVRLAAYRAGLSEAEVKAEYESGAIHIRCHGFKPGEVDPNASWQVKVLQGDERIRSYEAPFSTDGRMEGSVFLGYPDLWDPEHPNLYTVRIELVENGQVIARATRRVGFRSLAAEGDSLKLNGQLCMVRGILSWGWEPDRIAPSSTYDQALAEMRQVRALGFNLIKLCLFVPNPAYFDAADETGMLLWLEYPMWLPEVSDTWREQTIKEYQEMARLVSDHPSLVLNSLGCELNQSVDAGLLGQLNQIVRQAEPGALLCDNSGSGESYGGLEIDFSDFRDYHPYYDLQYFEPLLDHWRRDWLPARPWIFGEFCDSDTFRDQNEIAAAQAEGKRPWWLTRANPVTTWRPEALAAVDWAERLKASQPGFALEAIKQVSYRQSYVIRKYTLEALRRRKGMGGYILTGLRDTPISTSGVWDDLGRSKWTEEEYACINGEDILCLEVGRRRRWKNGGDRPDPIDPYCAWAGTSMHWYVILHAARQGFPAGAQVRVRMFAADGQDIAAYEDLLDHPIQAGEPAQAASFSLQMPAIQQAAAFTLEVCLETGSRQVKNRWPMWVYPRLGQPPERFAIFDPQRLLDDADGAGERGWLNSVPRISAASELFFLSFILATLMTEPLWSHLSSGGRILLLQTGEGPLPARRCPFWREGIKLFAPHPLWELFPQQGFSDMQFFGMASDLAFDTPRLEAALPEGSVFQPILRRLDAREFHISDYLFEARVGAGKLLGCSLGLQGAAGSQPAGWQRNAAGGAMLDALIYQLSSQ